jgi:hypothetical protein
MAGDMWDHTAVTADSKLVVSLVVGKRTQAQTNALFKMLREISCHHKTTFRTAVGDELL